MATTNATFTNKPIIPAQGGTGLTTITDNSVLVGSGTSAITPIVVGTNGQVIIGSTAADPVFATLSSTGGTISYTTGAGTLNIDTTAQPGVTWSVQTDTTQAAAADGAYIANNAGLVTVTLLAAASAGIGTKLRVTGINNATGWKIAQNASQQIFLGTSTTTAGVSGSLASTAIRDSVELVCTDSSGLFWNVISSIGNITVV